MEALSVCVSVFVCVCVVRGVGGQESCGGKDREN